MKEQTRVKTIRLRQEARQTEVLKPVGAARPAEWIDASKKKDGFSRLLRADRLIRNLGGGCRADAGGGGRSRTPSCLRASPFFPRWRTA